MISAPRHSILFPDPHEATQLTKDCPSCFADLNLGQIVASVLIGRERMELQQYFNTPVHSVDVIEYRHAVFRDLADPGLHMTIRDFNRQMRTMRGWLGHVDRLGSSDQAARWFLDAVCVYCAAVTELATALTAAEITSAGMSTFRDMVTAYAGSAPFDQLRRSANVLAADLAAIRYRLHFGPAGITVTGAPPAAAAKSATAATAATATAAAPPKTATAAAAKTGPAAQPSGYAAELAAVFGKFRSDKSGDEPAEPAETLGMNHVEAALLELVAQLHPEVFGRLYAFAEQHTDYLDPTVAAFDRQVQFYLAYLEYSKVMTDAGLPFCLPTVSDRPGPTMAVDAFDLALADNLVPAGKTIVCNDFQLDGPERILVVSGPNQGGKTTFARSFGQLHYLAGLGLPVPARSARLPLVDRLFTLFERGEQVAELRSKLEDDLRRIHDCLRKATSTSVVIMNEILTSTTVADATALSRTVLAQLIDLGATGLFVTFIEELSRLGPATVSMVGTVAEDDSARRTYRILRRYADGRSYAATLAGRYGLGRVELAARLSR